MKNIRSIKLCNHSINGLIEISEQFKTPQSGAMIVYPNQYPLILTEYDIRLRPNDKLIGTILTNPSNGKCYIVGVSFETVYGDKEDLCKISETEISVYHRGKYQQVNEK